MGRDWPKKTQTVAGDVESWTWLEKWETERNWKIDRFTHPYHCLKPRLSCPQKLSRVPLKFGIESSIGTMMELRSFWQVAKLFSCAKTKRRRPQPPCLWRRSPLAKLAFLINLPPLTFWGDKWTYGMRREESIFSPALAATQPPLSMGEHHNWSGKKKLSGRSNHLQMD